MKRVYRLLMLVAVSGLGAAGTTAAMPFKAAAAPPCPNIACYFDPPSVLYCTFASNWGCSMSSPDHCKMESCLPT